LIIEVVDDYQFGGSWSLDSRRKASRRP